MAPAGTTVRLLTHDAFALSQSVLDSFAAQTGASIEVIASGDAGTAVNEAILTKANPVADVLYGVDDTFLSRALDAGIFDAYQPAAIADVPDALKLDPEGRVTPIDYGDVCINIDLPALAAAGFEPPTTIDELTQPAWKGKLVVEDPGVSSPGLAFLLATIARFGETGDHTWRDYWAALRANDVQVASSWDDAYYGGLLGWLPGRATGRWWCRTPRAPWRRSTTPTRSRRTRPRARSWTAATARSSSRACSPGHPSPRSPARSSTSC